MSIPKVSPLSTTPGDDTVAKLLQNLFFFACVCEQSTCTINVAEADFSTTLY